MADVAWTKLGSINNADIFEAVLDLTDFDTEKLSLNPKRKTTIALRSTGAATGQLDLYYEDPDTGQPFTFDAAMATDGTGNDPQKASLGPISGLQVLGTIAGGDTIILQVIQSRSD